jgi:hypothetical protein
VAEESGTASESESGSPARRALRHPLIRRLPLLIVGLVGIWFWRTSVGTEHEVIYRLAPGFGATERVEIQLRDADGKLVKREVWFFDDRPAGDITQKLQLKSGDYQAQVFVSSRGSTQTVQVPVGIDADTTIVSIRPR